ncbi:2OG-Fe dioxygenase family protein [Ignatzschineria sp. RMDPL8A]|mgnify:FL=1|uniref:2OG-Fe dioxygenase family protein n=1 Tax=Ignatzschineria sp. RMDPL8A TaxID=2999236 RepID=UPI00244676EB|nr:2OG-Fe dioxygenase family protein [Ignatzschineria sp. RMDPL8A]MDG9729049.1 2OG-Fe dioxygenase family protein [Ignatzschineria sp. RMDPL8A]
MPISIISLGEIGISVDRMKSKLSKYYDEYQFDNYLLQQNKIDIIKKNLSDGNCISEHVLKEIYQGIIKDDELINFFPTLSTDTINYIKNLTPNRKRLISKYLLSYEDGNWLIERVKNTPFEQKDAQITDDNNLDYRKSSRVFKELPDDLCDSDLKDIMTFVANKIYSVTKNTKLNIVVHHTVIYCSNDEEGTNSPEGIHQDGMDLIVSALVIERRNILGAKSIIYGNDKKTEFVTCELQEGMGILQADKGTELWHTVTPIRPLDNNDISFRSSIGFDITLIG